MNDKIQLAAMGEHMAEQQPLCMARRIEELEAQVRVMAELLRDAHPCVSYMINRIGQGDVLAHLNLIYERIDDALAGKLPEPAVPEGWQPVPVEPTTEMVEAYFAGKMEAQSCTHQQIARERVARDYRAMLAAAPKPEAK